MSLRIGPYLVHFDALLARLVFLWRVHVIVLLLAVVAIAAGPSLLRWGQDVLTPEGALTIIAEGAEQIDVDRRPWDGRVKVGPRRIAAFWRDSVSWRDVVIEAGVPVTVTLTPGWSKMDVRRVALPQRAAIEFAIVHPHGAMTTIVRNDSADPNARRRQYDLMGDRVSVVPSADAFDGRYDRSPDGRTTVTVVPRLKESSEVVLSAENQEGSFRAAYNGVNVRFVVADPIRQGAFIFESDGGTNATRITWLTYRGRTVFIGAIDGYPTLVRWAPGYRAAVLIAKPTPRDAVASLFVLDMSGIAGQSEQTEFVPTLLSGGEQIVVPAAALSPPLVISGDDVLWASGTDDGADIWALNLSSLLVRKHMSASCPVRAFQPTSMGMTWLCRMPDSWQVFDIDQATNHSTGVAIFAAPIDDATGMDLQPDRGVWVGIAEDGALVAQWERP